MNFRGIPSFSPEHFRYINNADPLKSKQLEKGVDQLMDEGVAQLFTLEMNNRKVIGTVGALRSLYRQQQILFLLNLLITRHYIWQHNILLCNVIMQIP